MPAEMDDIMKMAAQILPAIILNTEAKFWNDYVLSFVRAGDSPDDAIAKADHILREQRTRFGAQKTTEALFENSPKADLRAIRQTKGARMKSLDNGNSQCLTCGEIVPSAVPPGGTVHHCEQSA